LGLEVPRPPGGGSGPAGSVCAPADRLGGATSQKDGWTADPGRAEPLAHHGGAEGVCPAGSGLFVGEGQLSLANRLSSREVSP